MEETEMKYLTCIMFLLLATTSTTVFSSDSTPASSHGIAYPAGWQNWAAIAVSHRTDNNMIRTIQGNDIAIEAERSGNTNPWPYGAIMARSSGRIHN
jgi:hypothetical protein